MKSARPDFSANQERLKPVINALIGFDPVDVGRDPDEGLLFALFGRIKEDNLTKEVHVWYDLPGGKPEGGETYAEAIIRELEEELGIQAEVVKGRKTYHMPHPFLPNSKKIFIVCRHVSGEPVNRLPEEHEELIFVSPVKAVELLGERISEPVRESLLNIGKLQNHKGTQPAQYKYIPE